MKRLVLAVVLVVALGLIVWAAFTRRAPEATVTTDVSDDVVMRFVETAVLPAAAHAVGGRCTTLLPSPTVAEIRLEVGTEKHAITIVRAAVLAGEDGGGIAPALSTCVSEALAGLKTPVPRLRVPLPPDAGVDAGVALTPLALPVGRAYELTVTLELQRLENPGYSP